MVLPKNVLVVEDEMMTQRYLKDILTNFGIEKVESFNNAQDTLDWLVDNECDLLLADINIKGAIDGIQMSSTIVKKYTIPIIFITAYSDTETLNEALDVSPFGYIVKPFTQADVELQIRVAYQKFMQSKEEGGAKKTSENNESKIIKISDDFEFSLDNNVLYHKGKEVYLPHKQNELVTVLVKSLNTVVSYEQLEYILWKDESHAASALRTLVYSLRNIVPELNIVSHSKMGYSLKSF